MSGFGTFLDTLQMIKHGIMAVELIALKAKKSFQDVFEPSAAMSEFVKQEKQMRIALMKGQMSQKRIYAMADRRAEKIKRRDISCKR